MIPPSLERRGAERFPSPATAETVPCRLQRACWCELDARRPQISTVLHRLGSSLMIDALSLLPTQKVTGVVELSTNTRRMFVCRGRRYSVNRPLFGSIRITRSASIPALHTSPLLSTTTSYGAVYGVGTGHS